MPFFSRLLLSSKTERLLSPLLDILLAGMMRVTNLESATSQNCQAQSFSKKLSKQGKAWKCPHVGLPKIMPKRSFLCREGREGGCHHILPLSGRVMHLSPSRLIERVWKSCFGIKVPCELLDLIYWQWGPVDLNLHMPSLLKTKKEKENLC